MKKIILLMLFISALIPANAQLFVNGDVNKDEKVNIADVNKLISMILGKDVINTPESLIAGTWASEKKDTIVLNSDGTTVYGDYSTFKYKALDKTLCMYDSNGLLAHVFNIVEVNNAYMVLKIVGQTEEVTYYNTKVKLPITEKEITKNVYLPDPFKGHEYVDLGLPSGTLWATTNVGQISSTDYTSGMYSWGAKESQWKYDSSNYPLIKKNGAYLTDCCKDNDLLPEYDIATIAWGEEWCMPTKEQIEELISNCEIKNFVFVGPNGNEITINNQYYIIGESKISDTGCFLWSKTLYTEPYNPNYDNGSAYCLRINMNQTTDVIGISRCYGLAVRPVLCKKKEEL